MKAAMVVVACTVQVVLLAGMAAAGGLDFFDDFNAFNEARWSKGDHNLGRSRLDPDNVGVGGGNLRLEMSASSLEGAEILSKELHGYGSYAARIQAPHNPSSITGFLLYAPPDYESEIDVEIYNDSSRRVAMHSVYANAWFPTWLEGRKPKKDQYVLVDSIQHTRFP